MQTAEVVALDILVPVERTIFASYLEAVLNPLGMLSPTKRLLATQ